MQFKPTQQPTFPSFSQTNNSTNAFKPVQFGVSAAPTSSIPAFNPATSAQPFAQSQAPAFGQTQAPQFGQQQAQAPVFGQAAPSAFSASMPTNSSIKPPVPSFQPSGQPQNQAQPSLQQQQGVDRHKQERLQQENEIQQDLLKIGSFCDPNNSKNLFLSSALCQYPDNVGIGQRDQYNKWYYDEQLKSQYPQDFINQLKDETSKHSELLAVPVTSIADLLKHAKMVKEEQKNVELRNQQILRQTQEQQKAIQSHQAKLQQFSATEIEILSKSLRIIFLTEDGQGFGGQQTLVQALNKAKVVLQDGDQGSLADRLEKIKKAFNSQQGPQKLDNVIVQAMLQEDPTFMKSLMDVTQSLVRELFQLKESVDQNQSKLDALKSIQKKQ